MAVIVLMRPRIAHMLVDAMVFTGPMILWNMEMARNLTYAPIHDSHFEKELASYAA